MKKTTIAIIVGIIVVGVGAITTWLVLNKNGTTTETTPVNAEVTDMTASTAVAITIHDLSFSPPSIKVKKGATVTWTNQDSVGHNVIADDAPDMGGLPTSHELLARGQTQSVTFARVGTFKYHCGAHAFMKGSVQVID